MSTVTLCRPQTEFEAGLVQGLLEDAGIPCVVLRLDMWTLGGMTRQYYGVWGEIRVDEAQLEDARDVVAVLSQGTAEEAQPVAAEEDWLRREAVRRLRWRQAFWGTMFLTGWLNLFYGMTLGDIDPPEVLGPLLLIITVPLLIALLWIARMRPRDGFIS